MTGPVACSLHGPLGRRARASVIRVFDIIDYVGRDRRISRTRIRALQPRRERVSASTKTVGIVPSQPVLRGLCRCGSRPGEQSPVGRSGRVGQVHPRDFAAAGLRPAGRLGPDRRPNVADVNSESLRAAIGLVRRRASVLRTRCGPNIADMAAPDANDERFMALRRAAQADEFIVKSRRATTPWGASRDYTVGGQRQAGGAARGAAPTPADGPTTRPRPSNRAWRQRPPELRARDAAAGTTADNRAPPVHLTWPNGSWC